MVIEQTGDWRAVEALIRAIKTEAFIATQQSMSRVGLKAEAIAKTHMSKQDLGWKPLSPKYLASKVRRGLSDNTLIATSTYFQSITSWNNGQKVFVGVKKQAVSEDGELLADIAKVHEFGSVTRSIPARPLWQPTLTEALDWLSKDKANRPETIFMQRLQKFR